MDLINMPEAELNELLKEVRQYKEWYTYVQFNPYCWN
jgi:hypothetical protein